MQGRAPRSTLMPYTGGCGRVSLRYGGKNSSTGEPARRPVSPANGRKSFLEWLAEMTPQEVAALPGQKREMRRRWLEGDTRYGVRISNANWRLGS